MNMGGPTAMPPPPPSVLHAQPAVQALNEIHSVHSGDDHMSQGTSATGRGGRRKKPFIPVTNAINLNV
jgi:hypothetical protein